MPDVLVITDREKEAIYEYSTTASKVNISNQSNTEIEMFFNGGKRQLKITDNGVVKSYDLVDTKKPEGTPTRLLRFGDQSILIDKKLIPLLPFPVVIDKEQ